MHYPVSLLDSIHGGVNKLGNYANLCNVNLRKAFDHVNYTVSVEKLIQLFIYIHGRGSWKSVNPHGVNPSAAVILAHITSQMEKRLIRNG